MLVGAGRGVLLVQQGRGGSGGVVADCFAEAVVADHIGDTAQCAAR